MTRKKPPEEIPEPPTITVCPRRAEKVAQLIVDGLTTTAITEVIEQAYPGDDPAALQMAALNLLAASGEADAAIVKGFCAAGAAEIYGRALKEEQYTQATAALRLLAQIHGIL